MVLQSLTRRSALLGFLAGPAITSISPATAASATGGLVILTIGGLVGATNRPALDASQDKFFHHNNISFQRARAFTNPDLSLLPQQTARVFDDTGAVLYRGPLLADILRVAEITSEAKSVRLYALDGYAAELPLQDVYSQKWLLASKAGGKAFGIGDRGPLYAVRELSGDGKRTADEDQKWVHSIYYIEVAP